MHPWSPPGHRHERSTFEVQHEFCEVRWPRTPRLATGLCANERRSVSDRLRGPGTTGCSLTAPTARKQHECHPDQAVPARVCAGVDWAKDDHAICIIDPDGQVLDRFTVTHDAAGLKSLVRRLLKAGVDEVGIERGDGPVVEALIQAELTVLVIPPGQLKNLRSRYGSAATRTTGSTPTSSPTSCAPTGAVCAPWSGTPRRPPRCAPPSVPAATWSSTGSPQRTNSERTCRSYSLAQQAFSPRSTPRSASTFLERFTTQTQADWLSPKRLGTWLASVSYSGRTDPEILHARLLAAPRGTTGADAETHTVTTWRSWRSCARSTPRSRPSRTASASNSPSTPTPTSSPPCPARGPCAQHACSPRSATPAAASPPRTRWPAWPASPLDPTVRQGQGRHLPVGSQQRTPRRPLRLRRRLPPRQPLGRRPLRPRPDARGHDHPHAVRILGPGLGHTSSGAAWQDNARLRPQPSTEPSKHCSPTPPRRPERAGLTQGNSCGPLSSAPPERYMASAVAP